MAFVNLVVCAAPSRFLLNANIEPDKVNFDQVVSCGANGKLTAFCLSRLSSKLGTDLGFFWFRIAANTFSLGIGVFHNYA